MGKIKTKLQKFLLIFLYSVIYIISGKVALLLSIPPFVSFIWLPIGIALNGVLRWGTFMVSSATLGSFLLNAHLSYSAGASLLKAFIIGAGFSAATSIGLLLGLFLVKKKINFPDLPTNEWDSIKIFFRISVVPLISSTLGVFVLSFITTFTTRSFLFSYLSWFLGDYLGIVICLPMAYSWTPKISRYRLRFLFYHHIPVGVLVLVAALIMNPFQLGTEIINANFELKGSNSNQNLYLVLDLLILVLGFISGLSVMLFTLISKSIHSDQMHVMHNQLLLEVNQKLIKSNSAKNLFLANVSHEIRTPMNSILGMAELLDETQLNSDQKSYVKVFKKSGQHLMMIINDLLDLSKIESGNYRISNSYFYLDTLIEEISEAMNAKAMEKKLALIIQSEVPSNVIYFGDIDRLRQVLFNLIGNAIKFTDEGHVTVHISVNQSINVKGNILFEVSDSGIGMDKDQKEFLFQPFSQLHMDLGRSVGGTGLGLFISKKLVEIMGGEMWCDSKINEGSKFYFTVYLPSRMLQKKMKLESKEFSSSPNSETENIVENKKNIYKSHPQNTAPEIKNTNNNLNNENVISDKNPSNSNVDYSEIRILLCDDIAENRLVVKALLKKINVKIDEVSSGAEAIEKVFNNKYDLVLMDIQMPEMNGYQATEKIRDIEKQLNRIPTAIVALTAYAMNSEVEKSIQSGCNWHLSKPVSKKDLIELIDKIKNLKETANHSKKVS